MGVRVLAWCSWLVALYIEVKSLDVSYSPTPWSCNQQHSFFSTPNVLGGDTLMDSPVKYT